MRRPALIMVGLLLALSACGGESGRTVTLVAHDFFFVSEGLLDEFTEDTGIEVEIVLGGDAGILVNQAILASGNPVGDVLFGVDNTLLARAVEADVFEPYRSDGAGDLDPALQAGDEVTPIDFGDVCINYDRGAFDEVPPPESLLDLTLPRYRGMLVVEDPTISSPGLAFLLATIVEFGESGDYTWRDYWADLSDNDLLIASDWGTAYYGHFSGASDGDRPLVVSYATSPGAELLGESPPPRPTTAALHAGCFRQVEYAGILRGTDDRWAAERLIDFLISLPVQEDVPGSMFVYPAHPGARLPDWLQPAGPPPERSLTASDIEENRARWLAEWSEIALG